MPPPPKKASLNSTLLSKTTKRKERENGKKGGKELAIEATKVPRTKVEKVGEEVAVKTI